MPSSAPLPLPSAEQKNAETGCAALSEKMLSDTKALEKFANRELDTAKTLCKQLQKVSDAIHNALNKLGLDIGKSAAKDIKYAQETVDAWLDGMTTAISNTQKRKEQREQAQQTETKVSYSQNDSAKNEYTLEALRKKYKDGVEVAGLSTKDAVGVTNDNLEEKAIKSARREGNRKNTKDATYVRFDNPGINVQIIANSFAHGAGDRSAEYKAVCMNISKIAKVAIPVNESQKTGRNPAIVYLAAVTIDNAPCVVRMVVSSRTGTLNGVKVLHAVKKEGVFSSPAAESTLPSLQGDVSSTSLMENRTPQITSSDPLSVDDFLNFVKDFDIGNSVLSNDVIEKLHTRRTIDKGITPHLSFSLNDSTGRELSEGQREYFSESEVRDDKWRLLPVYHATDADFTVFKREHLGQMTDGNASSEYVAATAHLGFWFNTKDVSKSMWTDSSKTKEVYLNIENPYHTSVLALADEMETEYGDAGMTSAEMGEAYRDELISQGYDGIIATDEEFGGTSFVIFDSNQAKNIDNLNPTANPDIRFSLNDSFRTDQAIRKVLGKAVEQMHEEYADIDFSHIGEDTYSKFRKVIPELRKYVNGEVTEASAEKLNNTLVSVMDDVQEGC